MANHFLGLIKEFMRMLFPGLVNKPDRTKMVPTVFEKCAYGVSDIASQFMYCPINVFLIYYYTEYINVNIAIVATIILCSRLLDGISDLIMGILIDKTKSPYGKSRVWLLRSVIPFFLATVCLFAVPSESSEFVKLAYIFFSYNLAVTVVFTMMNVPYGALSSNLTKDTYQRSLIAIYRMISAALGIVIINAATLPLVHFFGNTASAWTYTFVIFGALGSILLFITFAFCHERFADDESDQANAGESNDSSKLPIKEQLKALLQNKYWLILSLTIIMIYLGDVVYNTVNVYFCKYFLADDTLVGNLNVTTNICKIVAMIVAVPFLVKHYSKSKTLMISCILSLIAYVLRYYFPQDIAINYAAATLLGLAQGGIYSCIFSMMPDTVEYGEYKTHIRQEGLVFSGSSFGMKVAAGLGTVIAGFAMNLGGFVNNAETQSAEAMNTILLAGTFLPLLFIAVAAVLCLAYRLDKEYPSIIRELEQRRAH